MSLVRPPVWSIVLPILLSAVPQTASAADRYWRFMAACEAADWFGPPNGQPSTCWAASAGGAAGASLPGINDDVRIADDTLKATARVAFASAGRGAPAVAVRSLLLQGNASFAAGLTMDRGSLDVGDLALGLPDQAGRGLLALSGGEITAKRLLLRAGELELTGGSLIAGELTLHSQRAGARLTMTGGHLQAPDGLSVGTQYGQEAAIVQQAGTIESRWLTLGAFKGAATASWTLSGSGTAGAVADTLVVGGAGAGRLTLQAGTQVDASSAVVVGQAPGIDGELQLVGNSLLRTPMVTVGAAGKGLLTLGASSRLDSDLLVLGDEAGSEGRLVAVDLPAPLSITSYVIGRHGKGFLQVRSASSSLTDATYGYAMVLGQFSGSDGTLLLEQASLWFPFDSVIVGDQGAGLLQITGGMFNLPGQQLAIGKGLGGRGRVIMQGTNNNAYTIGSIDIGRAGHGTLELLDGARIDNPDPLVVTMGASAGGHGELTVSGAGSQLQITTLAAGGPGSNRVRLADGGVLAAGTVMLGPASVLVLDGGQLNAHVLKLGPAASLDWRAGTIQVSSAVTLDDVQLPRSLALLPGRTLRVAGNLIVADGAALTVAGGSLESPALALQSGSRLDAQGTLPMRLQGAAGSWIEAQGALSLGDATQTLGFVHAGVLWAGGQAVTLHDADAAELGLQTRLTDGGSLSAANGLWLPAGHALVSQGQARVAGALRNDGDVYALDGRLSFADTASGEGNWLGNLRFEAGFDPGDLQVDRIFGGGNLGIAPGAWLQLDIVSAEPRLGHDALGEIGQLSFEGELRLVFAPGFAADAGTRLQLLSFQSFSGRLDATNVRIEGLPAWRVDLSRLSVDGSLGIAPVPEPATWALWLTGLTGLGGRALRRRAAHATR
jgi:hypothetical protein